MTELRDGHVLDYVSLARLFSEVGWGERSEDPILFEALVRASPWVASAWVGGEAVGFARAITDGLTTAYLTDVCVHPDHRRRGLATRLVQRILEGRDGIHFVLRAEPLYHPLYLKLGFEPAPTMLRRPRR